MAHNVPHRICATTEEKINLPPNQPSIYFMLCYIELIMNRIVTIGCLGMMKAYLNISEDEAIERYCKSEDITRVEFDEDDGLDTKVIEFKEEFGCYSLWEDES